uniref:Uncharacterized protein n=1 Tax=Tanacetum cinerariifolium TaxID=118510 RepID=A0A699JE22_TANCI|nr:hypothetical protein [Tanacetum cinerariifolium]
MEELMLEEMSFRNFIYTEEDKDLTFLPKDFSLCFNTSSPSVSINTEPVRADEEPMIKPTTEPATEPVNEHEMNCKIRGGSSRPPVKRKLASGSSTSRTIPAKDFLIKDDTPMLSISDDDEDLLDLYDRCYARQAVVDNVVNRRSCELLEMSSLAAEEKEHKGNLDRLILKSQKWSGYQVSLLALESKVASLEAEKANLEATEPLLRQEIKEVKYDRKEAVSKVVLYACMELLYSDELGRIVGKLVSSAITFGRYKSYEQVARMKEPFDLLIVKGYRPSYQKEHTQASDDLATATFSWLNEYVADASASVEALLSKKPPTLQKHVPSRT